MKISIVPHESSERLSKQLEDRMMNQVDAYAGRQSDCKKWLRESILVVQEVAAGRQLGSSRRLLLVGGMVFQENYYW